MFRNFVKFAMKPIAVIILIFITNTFALNAGPTFRSSKGEIWPKPKSQQKSADYLIVRNPLIKFNVVDRNCELLTNAITRYTALIVRASSLDLRGRGSQRDTKTIVTLTRPWVKDAHFKGYLDKLDISLLQKCTGREYPNENMTENYTLEIQSSKAKLTAPTIWGILRGLESFSQLMYLNTDYLYLVVNLTKIEDAPRLSYRGLMLDTSRHFIPKNLILTTLDAMSYNKLNVFHWHLTDDQSFPYQSTRFPELSEKGAYQPVSKIYTQKDVQEVIEYARQRGIRVIPEFDTPGHTASWGLSQPDLLTTCYTGNTKNDQIGPVDPTKEKNFQFLQQFFNEITKVFPDKYVHIGGDEVPYDCWASNPTVLEFMSKLNITGNFAALESYYNTRVMDLISKMNANSIVWQEVFAADSNLKEGTIVNVWSRVTDYKVTLSQVTKAGKPAILSACYYLDYVGNHLDWIQQYICDPLNFDGTDEQKQLVIGGEVCMFTETVNEFNVISKVWPRACAASEQFWSHNVFAYNQEEIDLLVALTILPILDASQRLEEHTCRMNNRGIGAQPPNLGGVCL